MTQNSNKSLSHLLYPYIFMLKEGPEFKEDFLNYYLLILHTKSETLHSPTHVKGRKLPQIGLSKQDPFAEVLMPF